MGNQLSPGVDFKEIDGTNSIPAVASSTAAYAGHFNWGPVDDFVTVTDETNLASVYGKPTDGVSARSFLTAASFTKYAKSLRISRAIGSTARNSVAGGIGATSFLIKNSHEFETFTTSQLGAGNYFFARYPGSIGDSLRVIVAYGADSFTGAVAENFDSAPNSTISAENAGIDGDEIHVLLIDEDGSFTGSKGTVLEKFQGLSLASDAKKEDGTSLFYKNVINQTSAYIYANSLSSVFTNADKSLTHADVIASGFGYNGASNVNASTDVPTTVTVSTSTSVGNTVVSSGATSVQDHKLTFRAKFPIVIGQNSYGTVAGGNNVRLTFTKQAYNVSAVITASAVVTDIATGIVNITVGLVTNSSGVVTSTVQDIQTVLGATNITFNSQTIALTGLLDLFIDGVAVTSGSASASGLLSIFKPTGSFYSANLSGGGVVPSGLIDISFTGGSNGSIVAANVVSALEIFADSELVDVSLLFAENFFQGTQTYTSSTNPQKIIDSKLIEIVSGRRDTLAFLSAPLDISALTTDTARKAWVVDKFKEITSNSYVVFDSTPVQVYNKWDDTFVWIPSGGHIAGLCAYSDAVADVWFSPAGYNRGHLLGISKIAYNPKKPDRDDLFKARINPIVNFPGEGPLLFGDKTGLSKSSAFDSIPVRRLFITLEKAISEASKVELFEINDEFTRAAFRNMVEPYLRDVKGRRGLTDFFVLCDETNNTPEIVDASKFVGSIFLKPARSIRYVQLNFVATRTGVSFSEVIGTV